MYKYLFLLIASCTSLIGHDDIMAHKSDKIFSADIWITVPDGTKLAPFFNPKDCTSKLPWDLLDSVSMAMGEIQTESSIHVMPLVTQITYVLSGTLEVVLKEKGDAVPKTYTLQKEEAILTKPGSLFQLRNIGSSPCKTLYIVSPAYLYELDESGKVIYDDSFIVKETWQALEQKNWIPQGLASDEELRQERENSYKRLEERSKS